MDFVSFMIVVWVLKVLAEDGWSTVKGERNPRMDRRAARQRSRKNNPVWEQFVGWMGDVAADAREESGKARQRKRERQAEARRKQDLEEHQTVDAEFYLDDEEDVPVPGQVPESEAPEPVPPVEEPISGPDPVSTPDPPPPDPEVSPQFVPDPEPTSAPEPAAQPAPIPTPEPAPVPTTPSAEETPKPKEHKDLPAEDCGLDICPVHGRRQNSPPPPQDEEEYVPTTPINARSVYESVGRCTHPKPGAEHGMCGAPSSGNGPECRYHEMGLDTVQRTPVENNPTPQIPEPGQQGPSSTNPKENVMGDTDNEIYGLDACIAYCEALAARLENHTAAGASGEQYTGMLAEAHVQGSALQSAHEMQAAVGSAIAAIETHKGELEAQKNVQEAYDSNSDAGDKEFLTAGR